MESFIRAKRLKKKIRRKKTYNLFLLSSDKSFLVESEKDLMHSTATTVSDLAVENQMVNFNLLIC